MELTDELAIYVQSLARKICNNRKIHDHDDIVQECLLYAVKRIKYFDPKKSELRNYLYYTTMYHIVDIIRVKMHLRAPNKRGVKLISIDALKDQYEARDHLFEAPRDHRLEALRELIQIISTLHGRERIIFEMLATGSTYLEIGKRFGMCESRVGQIRQDVLDRLAERFPNYDRK